MSINITLTSAYLKQSLVVKTETKLGHTAQIYSHLYGSHDLTTQHVARRAHKYIHGLDHVQKDLILSILDILCSPRDRVGHRRWQFSIVCGYMLTFLGDILLQDLTVSSLWIAKVHEFVEKLVNDDKIVSNTFFFEFIEIFTKNLAKM